MGQLNSTLQDLEIDFTGVGTTFDKVVCLNTFQSDSSSDVTEEATNCGILTAVADPKISITGDGAVEYNPSAGYASYSDFHTAHHNKTAVVVRIQNPTTTGSSIGTAYYEKFTAFITQLGKAMDMGTYVKFSFTIQSTGTIDIVP